MPRQLLPVPAHFTGRDADLTALEELRAAHRGTSPLLVVVTGQAGVGKTALVSRWLGDLAPSFPDGQVYADLRGHSPGGPAGPGEILEQFIRAFGVAQVPPSPRSGRRSGARSPTADASPSCWTTR
ncbi:ATP-binding protein [Streptomyces sp. M19]